MKKIYLLLCFAALFTQPNLCNQKERDEAIKKILKTRTKEEQFYSGLITAASCITPGVYTLYHGLKKASQKGNVGFTIRSIHSFFGISGLWITGLGLLGVIRTIEKNKK